MRIFFAQTLQNNHLSHNNSEYGQLIVVITMKFLTELAIGFLWLNYIIIECEACLRAFTSVEQLAPPNYYGNFKVSKETEPKVLCKPHYGNSHLEMGV